ncbi:MAG: hypothetical protein J6Y25_04080 [Elusimicrobiaceae bacterium]|nr:hypothetical protein [Elusimicrobiaceae bacterium]MBP5616187.1 hypothetical protein [Elusimicrobiaceae bacterium]
MLLDQNLMFSDAQTISATAASTNVVDLTAAGNAVPGRLVLIGHVDTAFAGATQIVAALQTSDKSDFSSGVVTLASATLNATQLADTEKNLFALAVPAGMKRYLRVYYTVTGTVTAGAMSCFMADIVDMR